MHLASKITIVASPSVIAVAIVIVIVVVTAIVIEVIIRRFMPSLFAY